MIAIGLSTPAVAEESMSKYILTTKNGIEARGISGQSFVIDQIQYLQKNIASGMHYEQLAFQKFKCVTSNLKCLSLNSNML